MTSPRLNYQFRPADHDNGLPVMVFIHGLFGDLNNLGIIARAFSEDYPILRLDLRNHGQSFHADEMNYDLMAQDVMQLFEQLNLKEVILIGHSMGGKTAMKLTALLNATACRVRQLIVLDIAPVAYPQHRHRPIFDGLFAVAAARPSTRQQAKPLLMQHIKDDAVVQFMLKSFDASQPDCFRFNLSALFHRYDDLMAWTPVRVDTPTLFIKGGQSDYIRESDTQTILNQFPQATAFTVQQGGHWIHAEKPEQVIRAIRRFLNKNEKV